MIELDQLRSPNYSKNLAYVKGAYPCVVCGKPVPNPRYMVHLHGGGGVLVTEEELPALLQSGELTENADLYFYPIGQDCLRQHPELKPYARKQ